MRRWRRVLIVSLAEVLRLHAFLVLVADLKFLETIIHGLQLLIDKNSRWGKALPVAAS